MSQVGKYLEVLVHNDLKPYAETKNIFRANLLRVTLKRIFVQFDGRTLYLIFNSFIRSHFQYGNMVSPPSPQIDKNTLKCIQKLSQIEPEFKSYEERHKSLNLYSLKHKRLRGDLIAYSIRNIHEHPIKYLLKVGLNINLSVTPRN